MYILILTEKILNFKKAIYLCYIAWYPQPQISVTEMWHQCTQLRNNKYGRDYYVCGCVVVIYNLTLPLEISLISILEALWNQIPVTEKVSLFSEQ